MNPLVAHQPPLPGLRLPLGRRRLAPGGALAALAHAAIIGLLVAGGRRLPARIPGSGEDARLGGGGRPVNFFALPAAAPAQVDVPAAPRVAVSDLSALRAIPVDLPPVALAPEPMPVVAPLAGGGGPGGAAGGPAGKGTGVGGVAGAGVGPGTGDEAGYIVPAAPRTANVPPLGKVPGSVAGRTYRVTFWVSADGRVTQVEVDPPIADAEYGREFQQRMMAYRFYPAHTRDGRSVANVVTIPIRIGH